MAILDSTNFIWKSTPSYLIVRTHFVEHYNLLLSHLEENDYRYHSYQPDINRPLHVIIRNLRPTTAHEGIIAGFSEFGHHVTNIHNIKRFSDKMPSPIFSVDIQKVTNKSDIYKTEFLLNSKNRCWKTISTEKLTTVLCMPDLWTYYCFHDPLCVKYGENHFSYSCTKPRDSPVICALHNSSHTANYKDCTDYKNPKRFNSPIRRGLLIRTLSLKKLYY